MFSPGAQEKWFAITGGKVFLEKAEPKNVGGGQKWVEG